MSRNNRVTLATFNACPYIYHKQDKKTVGGQMWKKKQTFYSKSDCFRHNSIPYKPRRTLQTEKSKEKNNKASVRLLSCLRNFWKFKGRSSSKRKEHKNFIPFYVLLSFLVCINTDSKVQTGATLFKTALKVELFSCFDGRPITRARKKILRPAPFEIRRRTFLKVY